MNIGEFLLERRLLLIGNFILTSGKTSPYYLDLRKLPNYPEFVEIVNLAIEKVKNIESDMIIGIATGGVPLASFIACKLGKPLGYVRLEKKGHGTDKLLEAEVKGKTVLVVDDVATTGSSIEKAVNEIRKNGGIVSNAFVIIDRREGAQERLEKIGVKLNCIFTINDILKDIIGKLGENERKLIQEYLAKNVE